LSVALSRGDFFVNILAVGIIVGESRMHLCQG